MIAITNSSLLALSLGTISPKLQVIGTEGHQDTRKNFDTVQGNKPGCSLWSGETGLYAHF